MSRAWPLTVYFASLVVFALLAGVAATVYVFVQTDRDSRHTAEQNAAFAARAAARELGDGVATVKASVAGLAATPGIDAAAGQPSCTLSFSVGSLNRGHIDILRPDGSVACSSRKARANGQHRSYAGSPWLAEGSKGAVLEAPVADTVTGDPSVVSTAPTPGHGYVATFVALEPVAASFV